MCHLPGRAQKCSSPFHVRSSCQRTEVGICIGSLGERGGRVSDQLVSGVPRDTCASVLQFKNRLSARYLWLAQDHPGLW